ncbi:hypothetical protein ACQKFL_00870 [Vreelandella titanicae]|uniref:hypothetical protein n=1 Tax=Vreelandella titanicae TaxID=664683 RepID=UPI003D00E271
MDNAPRATNSPVAIGIDQPLRPDHNAADGAAKRRHLAPGTWHLAEVFGIHAAPTAVTTLGLALIMFQGFALWSGEEEAKERAATGRELLRLVISC